MSDHEISPRNLENITEDEQEGEGERTPHDYGEGGAIPAVHLERADELLGEIEGKEWEGAGEYGEGDHYYIFRQAGEGEAFEITSLWERKETSATTIASEEKSEEKSGERSEVEETEEERELRLERELLIEDVRQKILDRMLLRRKNAFLQKKLIELFKKRRMDNAFKEEPKGLDLEKKYLKRLHAFQEFKKAQEDEIEELTVSMETFESDTKLLEDNLDEKLVNFMARAKEVSLNLILSKTGKKLSEKAVDRLLRRQIRKNDEKGRKKLQYIKVKNLIEEKERQLKAMEYIGEGLYVGDYEQMKIDNHNFLDKIEEKEDELTKMRQKTQVIMQNLSHVREKAYAIEGDIELMEEKVYAVEKKFGETRKRLTESRTKRDSLREEYARLKLSSGLLTKNALLRDFESSIYEGRNLAKKLEGIKKLMHEKTQEMKQSKALFQSNSEVIIPSGSTKLKTKL